MRQVAHLDARARSYACAFDARRDVTRIIRLACAAARGKVGEKSTDLQSDPIPATGPRGSCRKRLAEGDAVRSLARRVGQMPDCAWRAGVDNARGFAVVCIEYGL